MSTETLYDTEVQDPTEEHGYEDHASFGEPSQEQAYEEGQDEPRYDEQAYADQAEQQPEAPSGDDSESGGQQAEREAAAPAGEAPEPLEQLPLELTLRCGELRLTLGELQHLGSGTIVEVHGVRPGHATLCHGDRVLAEGELVDVDGRLGLQITRTASAS